MFNPKKSSVAFFFVSLLLALLHPYRGAIAAESYQVFTEDFAPYNYLDNGKLVGLSVDVVDSVFRELKASANYQVLPWARAYEYALNTPNTLIFSLARNPQREKLFKWVGAISAVETCLFAFESSVIEPLYTLEQAKKFRVVTQLQGHISIVLTKAGFIRGGNLIDSVSIESSLQMLKAGRADIIGLPRQVLEHYMQYGRGKTEERLKTIICFDNTALYLAFNKDTPDETVLKFKQAMIKVKKSLQEENK
ncbi:substrate-binding periplasmic protein [Thalassotalea marina]|uniref:Solute-binding protein family 3/N-terminal domain-containing protein n=1 Tax=Thalassotalea marina TaxID=1673741 RepID=A0A919EH89_9GAMM|nr:ABC transporter substrate-binding protein [Thalassotalea marina]GHF79702.1 hypothetical protein GCM10017161_03610 [Thalassotalea marina]